MTRVPRNKDWDTRTSLNDYPTDNITPVNIGDELPMTATNISSLVYNWLQNIFRRTKNGGKEYGFYIDSYGNVIGIFEGSKSSISFPADYHANRLLTVHTHLNDPIMSPEDIEVLVEEQFSEFSSKSILPVPEGDETYLITLSTYQEHKAPDNATSDADVIADIHEDIARRYINNIDIGVTFGLDSADISNKMLDLKIALSEYSDKKFELTATQIDFSKR